MTITMTVDQFPQMPESGDASGPARQHAPSRGIDLRNAGIIFTAIAVALGGIFGIVELSSRRADKAIEVVHDQLDSVKYRVDTLHLSHQELVQRVARLETSVDQRFEKLETKMEKRFEQMDKRFEQMDKKFERLDEKLDRMDERFDRMDEKFERMTDALLLLVGKKSTPANTPAATTRESRSR